MELLDAKKRSPGKDSDRARASAHEPNPSTAPSAQSNKHAIAQELAQGYSPVFRFVEISSIALFALMIGILGVRVYSLSSGHTILISAAALAGWVLADFMSGLVHWGADTWGSARFPILGPTLIRSFREHHVDPTAITRHDFVETNGASCLVCLPILGYALTVHLSTESVGLIFLVTALSSLSFWTLMTNQAHQWAHQGRKAHPWVRKIQSLWIVLPAARHAEHHQTPFVDSYCITTGWLNPLLNRIQLFRGLEWLVYTVTGAIPRLEDQKLTES